MKVIRECGRARNAQGWRKLGPRGLCGNSNLGQPHIYIYIHGWWFQTFFIFHNIWDNPSHWLIFFNMVQTTNQLYIHIYIYNYILIYANVFEQMCAHTDMPGSSALRTPSGLRRWVECVSLRDCWLCTAPGLSLLWCRCGVCQCVCVCLCVCVWRDYFNLFDNINKRGTVALFCMVLLQNELWFC